MDGQISGTINSWDIFALVFIQKIKNILKKENDNGYNA